MSEYDGMMKLGAKIVGGIALAATLAFGTGAYFMHERAEEKERVTLMDQRAEDTLRNRSLTDIAAQSFKKSDGDAERPYAATFTAKDSSGQTVEGSLRSAPNRDTAVTLKP